MEGTADVAEDEEQAAYADDGLKAYAEEDFSVLSGYLHEGSFIELVEQVFEIEHVHGVLDAQRNGCQGQARNYHVAD